MPHYNETLIIPLGNGWKVSVFKEFDRYVNETLCYITLLQQTSRGTIIADQISGCSEKFLASNLQDMIAKGLLR